MTNNVTAKHLVMRFADTLCCGLDTVREHQDVIAEQGTVWMGKIGRPLAGSRIDLLNEQIADGRETNLYLVQRRGSEYEWTAARMAAAARSLPRGGRRLVPRYYDELKITGNVRTWFLLTDLKKAKPSDVGQLYVVSSGKPISDTLAGSMAGLFLVEHETSIQARRARVKKPRRGGIRHEDVMEAFEEGDGDDDF